MALLTQGKPLLIFLKIGFVAVFCTMHCLVAASVLFVNSDLKNYNEEKNPRFLHSFNVYCTLYTVNHPAVLLYIQ